MPDFTWINIKTDKNIMLAAVKQNGLALKFASDELKNDKELVIAAVKQNALTLKFASDTLRNDKEILIIAFSGIKKSSDTLALYKSLNITQRKDSDVILAILNNPTTSIDVIEMIIDSN
jgi:hypothetical protein